MADSRNWSTKTLAKQLVLYLSGSDTLDRNSSIEALIESLKSDIVEEEVGESLDPWQKS